MADRTIGRSAAAGVMATALVGAGIAPATAAPAAATTTSGWTFAFLWTGEESGPGVFLDLFSPPGRSPFAGLDVFVDGYECQTVEPIPAEFDAAAGSASAQGTLDLVCGAFDRPEVTGQAVVDITFAAGDTTRYRGTVSEPGARCRVHRWVRDATTTGGVTVLVPDLGMDTDTVAREAEFTVEERRCRPTRRG